MKKTIKEIQKENIKIYLAITGGGTESISKLLKYGGSSDIFMNAYVPYNQEALTQFLKQIPQKCCSEKTARLMAIKAYETAIDKDDNNIGIGITCSLNKENERISRENVVHIALHSKKETCSFTFNLFKHISNKRKSTREIQEEQASNLLINCLLYFINNQKNDFLKNVNYKCLHYSPEIDHLNDNKCFVGLKYEKYNKHKLILPGSFNPMHEGHTKIAKIASELLNYPVTFEISTTNFEKPSIDFIDIKKRLEQINLFLQNDNKHVNSVILTNAPLFIDKINLFEDATYIIGYDTYNRMSKSISNFEELKNAKFLVFHRSGYSLDINQKLNERCQFISEEIFFDKDKISSTSIREKSCTQQ